MTSSAPKPKLRILVADDSAHLRKIILRYLRTTFDIESLEAGNGAEAEALLQESLLYETEIDLIFLDWMMPEVTGYEFLKKIRGIERFSTQPAIIMLTAETYPEQIAACLKYDVARYVTKPFTEKDLVDAVHAALAKKAERIGVSRAV